METEQVTQKSELLRDYVTLALIGKRHNFHYDMYITGSIIPLSLPQHVSLTFQSISFVSE